MSGFWFTLALLLCFGLLAGPASASADSFQLRYDLPQAPETLLKEILARPEFGEDDTQSFLDEVWERLYRELARLFARLLEGMPSAMSPMIAEQLGRTIVRMMLLGAAGLLAIYVLFRIFSLVAKRRSVSGAYTPEPDAGPPGLAGSRDSWDQALIQAEKADYAQALINLFRFALFKLDEAGVLLFHRGKTNREILESLNNDSLRKIVAEMVPRFNRVRYGKAFCDRLEYEHFLGLCRRLAERV